MYKTNDEMKKYLIFASTAACLVVAGCVKDKEKDFADDQVVFSATTGALETRTEYGETGTVDETKVQYVDWVTGDEITILMSTGSTDDYTVTNIHDGSDSNGISKASLSAQGSGLSWGTGTDYRTFYAMYPKSGTNGSSLAMVSGSPAMSCVIPATWTPTDATLERLPYGYMFARLETPRTTSVSLTFDSKFTAFCFTLKNPTASDVTLSSFTLSSASKAMNGTYTVNTSNGNVGILPTAGDNKSVTVNFSSLTGEGLVIPRGTTEAPGTRTFTIVTVPDTFDDLTVSCVSDGVTKTRVLKQGSTYYSFAAGKKHNISITLPDFTAYTYEFSVIDPTDLVASQSGSSSTGNVTSYKTNNGGITKTALPWSVEGYYSTYESALAGGTGTGYLGTTKPSWLNTEIASASTPVPSQTLYISYANSLELQNTGLRAVIDSKIANTPTVGTEAAPINLADAAHGIGTTITESANCYIINGPGWYKIPLVMGNSVKNDLKNENKYTYEGATTVSASSGGAFARDFYNYQNTKIKDSSPFLSLPNTASIIWQDVSGLVGSPAIMTGDGSMCTVSSKTVYWLKFQVNAVGQGNAIISVKDGDGKVMWSYHIWVTDYTSSDDATDNMNSLLGWVTTEGSRSRIQGSSVFVRLKQNELDGITQTNHTPIVLSLVILDGDWGEGSVSNGYAPYYQWGRKDPIMPNIDVVYDGSGTPISFSTWSNTSHSTDSGAAYYYYSILQPGAFIQNTFYNNSTTVKNWVGGAVANCNYWCAKRYNDSAMTVVEKTIFDPCPANYSLPYPDFISSVDLSFLPLCSSFGYRIHKTTNASSPTPGSITSPSTVYLWTAYSWASSAFYNMGKGYDYNGSTGTIANHNEGDALCILPMKNSN